MTKPAAADSRPSRVPETEARRKPRINPDLKRWIMRAFWLLGLVAAGVLVWLTLRNYSLGEIVAAMKAVPPASIALALLFAAASYATLTLSDRIALRHLGHRIRYPSVALASFVSLSIGHTVGFSGLSSGAIRYRFYRRHGVHLADLAKLTALCGLTVALGLLSLSIAPLLMHGELSARLLGSATLGRTVAALAALAVAVYLLLAWRFGGRTITRWKIGVPHLRTAVAQTLVGAVNFALVSACLFVLVRTAGDVDYLDVAAIFVLANIATLVTHVPGGIGVIESVVILLLPGEAVVGPVLLFRIVYFLVPLAIGAVLLAVTELAAARARDGDTRRDGAANPARTAPRDRESASPRRNERGPASPGTAAVRAGSG